MLLGASPSGISIAHLTYNARMPRTGFDLSMLILLFLASAAGVITPGGPMVSVPLLVVPGRRR